MVRLIDKIRRRHGLTIRGTIVRRLASLLAIRVTVAILLDVATARNNGVFRIAVLRISAVAPISEICLMIVIVVIVAIGMIETTLCSASSRFASWSLPPRR